MRRPGRNEDELNLVMDAVRSQCAADIGGHLLEQPCGTNKIGCIVAVQPFERAALINNSAEEEDK